MTTALNWLYATLLAAAICLGTAIGGPDDIQAEVDSALSTADAHANAARTARDVAHARALEAAHAAQAPRSEAEAYRTVNRVCRSLHAERALVLRTTDGDWVCRRMNASV
jgi:cytochrome c5